MKKSIPRPWQYKNNSLYFEGKSISSMTAKYKTPFYLYSEKNILDNYDRFVRAAKSSLDDPALVCYAMKANSCVDILKSLAKAGSGADIVSGGELKKAILYGISPKKIVFSGVGKTAEEIEYAIKKNILAFNVESIEELLDINRIARKLKKTASISFRLNPQVNAKTHKHISTGNKTHKFGILGSDILKSLKNKIYWSNTKIVGISVHIGSQLTCMKATKKAIREICVLADKIKTPLEFVDVGGGLGIDYEPKEKVTSVEEYMEAVGYELSKYFNPEWKSKKFKVVFEPGRYLVGGSGVIVSKVVRTKVSENCHFTILDCGMNDLIRPSLYEAYHEILPINKSAKKIKTDIVGPVCETADCFATQRKIPKVEQDDYLVIADTGAYGHVMSSNYNSRDGIGEYLLTKNSKVIKTKH